MEDNIIDSIGATIGFVSYKLGNKAKSVSKKILSTVLLILIFSFMLVIFAEIFG